MSAADKDRSGSAEEDRRGGSGADQDEGVSAPDLTPILPGSEQGPGDNAPRNVYLLFKSLWRLIRGEDQRARKVRWMIRLLRPYRGRMTLMFIALLIETGAGLAPPYLAGRAIDAGIKTGNLSALNLTVAAFVLAAVLSTPSAPTPRPTWSAGSAPGRCRICANASFPTSNRCRSGSLPAAAQEF